MQGELIKAWYDSRAVYAAVAVTEQETVDGEPVASRVEYNVCLPRTPELNEQFAAIDAQQLTPEQAIAEKRAIVEPLMVQEFLRMYAEAHPTVTEIETGGVVDLTP